MRLIRESESDPKKEIDIILWALWVTANEKTLTEKEFKVLVPEYKYFPQMVDSFYKYWVTRRTFPRNSNDVDFVINSKSQQLWKKNDFEIFIYFINSSLKYLTFKINEGSQDQTKNIIFAKLLNNSVAYLFKKYSEFKIMDYERKI